MVEPAFKTISFYCSALCGLINLVSKIGSFALELRQSEGVFNVPVKKDIDDSFCYLTSLSRNDSY